MRKQGRPPATILVKFPNRIRELREARHMTQEQLADQVHMSTSNVGKLERGDLRLRADQMALFARALGCEPVELLSAEQSLSANQKQLLALFNRLSSHGQRALLKMASSLEETEDEPRRAG